MPIRGSSDVEGLHILGPGPDERSGLVAFTLGEIHPHDLSAVLDREGVAIRAGHHCAQPVHDKLGGVPATRASVFPVQHARRDRRAGRHRAARDPDAALMELADLYRDVIVDHDRQAAQFRQARGRDSLGGRQ